MQNCAKQIISCKEAFGEKRVKLRFQLVKILCIISLTKSRKRARDKSDIFNNEWLSSERHLFKG